MKRILETILAFGGMQAFAAPVPAAEYAIGADLSFLAQAEGRGPATAAGGGSMICPACFPFIR